MFRETLTFRKTSRKILDIYVSAALIQLSSLDKPIKNSRQAEFLRDNLAILSMVNNRWFRYHTIMCHICVKLPKQDIPIWNILSVNTHTHTHTHTSTHTHTHTHTQQLGRAGQFGGGGSSLVAAQPRRRQRRQHSRSGGCGSAR